MAVPTMLPPPWDEGAEEVTLESFVGLVGQGDYWVSTHDTQPSGPPDECEELDE